MADANRSSEQPSPPDTTRGGERGERAIAAVRSGLRRLGRWAVRFAGESARAWRYLDFEQRVAGVGALLLIVSTFGPFSFVEGAIILVALAVLLLLKKRADGRSFHLPFGDGAVIMAAGAWSGLLIVIRLFDRPLGQNLLALVCAAILTLAGLRMRLRRPADDLPQERQRPDAGGPGGVDIEFAAPSDTAETEALPSRPELQRQTPAARRPRPAPAPAPPTAVRPSTPQPPLERADPDFDLPDAPRPPELQPPPAAEDAADSGPFRARPAAPSEAPPPSRRVPPPRRED
jgi:hypothetical protein